MKKVGEDYSNKSVLYLKNFIAQFFQKVNQPYFYHIMISMFLLIIIGMVFIFSSMMFSSQDQLAFNFVIRQLISVIIGVILMLFFMIIPISWYQNKVLIYGLNVLLVMVLLYTQIFGVESGGSRNWLDIFGLSIQPSEFSKIAILVMVATFISSSPKFPNIKTNEHLMGKIKHYQKDRKQLVRDIIHYREVLLNGIIILSTMLILVKMPDMGMVIMIVGSMLSLLIVMFCTPKVMTVMISGVVGFYLLLRTVATIIGHEWIASGDYQKVRLGIFVNPFIDEQNTGYQLIQSLIAFSRGGWFGAGIGKGLTKQINLPAAHTDFISAVIAEEIGWVGMSIVLLLIFGLYFYIIGKIIHIQNIQHYSIALVLTIMFMIQSIINLGGALSLIPLTGLTLPFISYGGTSIMVSMSAMGIILKMLLENSKVDDTILDLGEERINGI